MTSRDFCYWLQGFFELAEQDTLSPKQTECIKRHLALVFVHEIDPSAGDAEHQAKLSAVHNPGGSPFKRPPGPGSVKYRC